MEKENTKQKQPKKAKLILRDFFRVLPKIALKTMQGVRSVAR